MALKYGMEGFFGAKMVAQLRVEEHNEEVPQIWSIWSLLEPFGGFVRQRLILAFSDVTSAF